MPQPLPNAYGLPETRRFQRVRLNLSGRYMFASRSEFPCRTENISPGGMLLTCPGKPAIGEAVVVYLDALGRFEGNAVRIVPEGFAMTLNMSPRKREHLADQLTWFANRKALNLEDERRHERFAPILRRAVLRLPNSKETIVKILNFSRSGVAVESELQPNLGTPVLIGTTPIVVVRHFENGFAGEFVTPFGRGEIDELTRL